MIKQEELILDRPLMVGNSHVIEMQAIMFALSEGCMLPENLASAGQRSTKDEVEIMAHNNKYKI